jgi:hypothetical protein
MLILHNIYGNPVCIEAPTIVYAPYYPKEGVPPNRESIWDAAAEMFTVTRRQDCAWSPKTRRYKNEDGSWGYARSNSYNSVEDSSEKSWLEVVRSETEEKYNLRLKEFNETLCKGQMVTPDIGLFRESPEEVQKLVRIEASFIWRAFYWLAAKIA